SSARATSGCRSPARTRSPTRRRGGSWPRCGRRCRSTPALPARGSPSQTCRSGGRVRRRASAAPPPAPSPIDTSEIDDISRQVAGAISSSPFRLPAMPLETDLVAKYFRGLGDSSRLRILELLQSEGELSVGALVERLGLPQPQLSNHLACLR